jgi:predicted P-loop ATPase
MNEKKPKGLTVSAKEHGKTSRIVEFLNEEYDIAIDAISNNRMYITAKKRKYDFPIKFDDIILHMWDENITVSDSVLRKILLSPNYIKTVNPVEKYFADLEGKYKGKSHIDILCSHLKARDYGDQKKKNYYQDRLCYLVRKWLVALVAQVKGVRMNDVALGFVHQEEGVGKTFLTQFLCPPDLNFYYDSVNSDNNKMTLEDIFSRNLIVNFDELVGINKKNPEDFKQIMSMQEVTVKVPHDPFPKKVKRLASATFTSNLTPEMGGFIHPNMGYRRFATIELIDIDKKYSEVVDINQVYAEAVMLLKQDFPFSWECDYESFKEANQRYLIESPAMKYARLFMRKPVNGEGKFMTASEIFEKLYIDKKIRSEDFNKVSSRTIGEALSTLGFERTHKYFPDMQNNRYGYDVTFMYDSTN